MLNNSNIKKIYALSPMQEGMLFHYIMDKDSHAYFEQLSYTSKEKIELSIFENALNKLIAKYDVLRTTFIYDEINKPKQIVLRDRKTNIHFEDISAMDTFAKTRHIAEYKERDICKGFNLSKDILIRVSIFKTEPALYKIIWSFHHILMDGWCLGIIFKEFNNICQSLQKNLPVSLDVTYPYFNYIKWLEKQDKDAGKSYWQKYLADYELQASLPKKNARKAAAGYIQRNISFTLLEEVTRDLEQIASNHGVTLNILFQSIWGILLQKYNNSEDVVFGAVVSGRPAEITGVEKMVGLFINTIPVRILAGGHEKFSTIIKKIQMAALESERYSYFPLAEIQAGTKLKHELIDHIVGFENYPIDRDFADDSKAQISQVEVFEQTNYDFNVMVWPGKELTVKFNFNSIVYEEELIQRLGQHFNMIVSAIVNDPNVLLSEIKMITEVEEGQILCDFNNTTTEYPRDKTIQKLFEEQVAKTPNNIAVIHENKQMTYDDLNRKANQLAVHLREKGVKADTIVAILVERSFELVIGIIGILKAGGAYLPLDPEFPEERIHFMLDDSQIGIVLTQGQLIEKYKAGLEIIDINKCTTIDGNATNLDVINRPQDLAYVIYTSGSTGKPKGVMVQHQGICNLQTFFKNRFEVNQNDKILQFASVSFDASVWEMCMALLSGASLNIVPKEIIYNNHEFENFLNYHKITIATLPPNYAVNLNTENIFSLRKLIVAGSASSKALVERWRSKVEYVNAYGPTETTVCATTWNENHKIENYNSIPIGKPINNNQVYILNNSQLQPIGVIGELCISGDSIARGYLNRPELTTEKFVINPFSPGKKMYRTGDLGRWLPDGNIEFIGRIDHQVKIRGFRIEPGEIESKLLKHDSIVEAIVIDRDDSDGAKHLCAYIVAKHELAADHLREYLSRDLPDYMIPSFFMQLERFPLTQNGKIDRKELLQQQGNIQTGVQYEAPRNEIETGLVKIWQSVLQATQIGINDSFFSLGGDSIKAMQVSARLQNIGLKLELKDLFQHPTIGEISSYITTRTRQVYQGIIEGKVELTPIQHWFFQNVKNDRHHFNQFMMLYREDRFEVHILQEVFTKIVAHHDALRMVYHFQKDIIDQSNQGIQSDVYSLEVFDFRNESEYETKVTQAATVIQSSIDLNNGPLIKLGLFKTPDGDHLLIVIHHLVVDGVSWRIILEDFATAYGQVSQGLQISLPSKTDSFREWAGRQLEFARSTAIKSERTFWEKMEAIAITPLPRDYGIATNIVKDSKILTLRLTTVETQQLLKETNRAYNTEINDLLLTALGMAVRDWSGADKIILNLEGHGREAIIPNVDITRTVGWFTTAFPVIIDMCKWEDLPYQIKYVKESIRRIPNKGTGYGIIKFLSPKEYNEKNGFSLNPEINFNYLGQFDRDVTTEIFKLSTLLGGDAVSGNHQRQYTLDINGMVTGGRLTLTFNYNLNEYREETICKLVTGYKKRLLEIISHCQKQENSELTPSDFGDKELSLLELTTLKKQFDSEIHAIYLLSHMQSGMLFNALRDKQSEAYFEQMSFTFRGDLDIETFERSFNILIQRHEVLRTNFVSKGVHRPRQVVLKEKKLNIDFHDLTSWNELNKQSFVAKYKRKDRANQFDLTKDTLIRLTFLKTAAECHEVIWSFHHIIMDGWCLGIIIKELLLIYQAFKEKRSPNLDQTYSYRSYIDWLENQDKDSGKLYWKKYLADYEQQTSLPKKNNSKNTGYLQRNIKLMLDEKLTRNLELVASNHGVTLNTVFQCIWAILLQKYNNTTDVVFGAVVSGRPAEITGIEKMAGLFINTIPVRIHGGGQETFSALIKRVQVAALESEKYSYLELSEIQVNTALKGELIDHIIVFENYPIDREIAELNCDAINLQVSLMEVFEQTSYDLNIIVELGKELSIKLIFNGFVYDEEFIRFVGMHIKEIAKLIVSDSNVLLSKIDMITETEKKLVLYDFNNTLTVFSKEKTMHELFEEQVARTPKNIALVYEESRITYEEINQKANRLALLLREKGVGANSIIGIMLKRSPEFIIGILGIIKAGGAIAPIDPEYPKKRIEYIIANSKINLMLTREDVFNQIFNSDSQDESLKSIDLKEIIFMERQAEFLDENVFENIKSVANANDMLYAIYTSGSTGDPKGVMITHKNVINLILFEYQKTDINFSDNVLQFTTTCFDVCYQEIFSTLLAGGTLCIANEVAKRDPLKLFQFIKEKQISVIFLPTSFLKFIFNEKEYVKNFPSLIRHIITAGEQLIITETLKTYLNSNNVTLHNHYGPSETHVVTTYSVNKNNEIPSLPPIGKPISNNQVYILNQDQRLQPVGVAGELYISGANVGIGYLNQPNPTFAGGALSH